MQFDQFKRRQITTGGAAAAWPYAGAHMVQAGEA